MTSGLVMQGRQWSGADLELIRGLLDEHPEWCRSRLSVELCERWAWRNAQGRLKDMAARTLLLKLERAGHLRLPARRGPSPNGRRNRLVPVMAQVPDPIRGVLRELRPLSVSVVAPGSQDLRLFNGLLAHEHENGKADFEFITTPGIGPTHNLAEQAVRFVVIDRRITQGTRSLKGRETCERLWTVVGTCAMQGRSAFEFILAAVRAYFRGEPAPSLLPALG